MARKRSNGRFKKQTSRRRSKPKISLTNVAVSLAVASAISNNVAGVGLRDFFLAGTAGYPMNESGWTGSGSPHRTRITLKEIFANDQFGTGDTPMEGIMTNLKANWVPLTMAVIGIPVIAKVATKALRKTVILPTNRMLKGAGLEVKV